MKLLLVEDDPDLRRDLQKLVVQWGYACEAVGDSESARALLKHDPVDLVLLDLGLPDGDGRDLCRSLRQGWGASQPMVLMLTARDSSTAKVSGFDAGADDYVVKPFDPAVLQARIKALLRRAERQPADSWSWGPLRMTAGESRVLVHGEPVDLTRREALFLELLLRAGGRACSKDQLLAGSSDGRREVGDDTVRTHMRNLRRKLMDAGAPSDLIETVHGIGYRLNPDRIA